MTNTIKTTLKGYFKQLEATNVTIDLDNGDYYADYNDFHICVMKYETPSIGYLITVKHNGKAIVSGVDMTTQKNAIMIINNAILNALEAEKEINEVEETITEPSHTDLKEGDIVVMTNSRGAKGFMLVVFNNVEQSFLVLSKSRYGTFSTPYHQRSYESIETFHKSDWLEMQETISKHNQRLAETF